MQNPKDLLLTERRESEAIDTKLKFEQSLRVQIVYSESGCTDHIY